MENRMNGINNFAGARNLFEQLKGMSTSEVNLAAQEEQGNSDVALSKAEQQRLIEEKNKLQWSNNFMALFRVYRTHLEKTYGELGEAMVAHLNQLNDEGIIDKLNIFEVHLYITAIMRAYSRPKTFDLLAIQTELEAIIGRKADHTFWTARDGSSRTAETWNSMQKKVKAATFNPVPGLAAYPEYFPVRENVEALDTQDWSCIVLAAIASNLFTLIPTWGYGRNTTYDGIAYMAYQARAAVYYLATKFLMEDARQEYMIEALTYSFFPIKDGHPVNPEKFTFDYLMLQAYYSSLKSYRDSN